MISISSWGAGGCSIPTVMLTLADINIELNGCILIWEGSLWDERCLENLTWPVPLDMTDFNMSNIPEGALEIIWDIASINSSSSSLQRIVWHNLKAPCEGHYVAVVNNLLWLASHQKLFPAMSVRSSLFLLLFLGVKEHKLLFILLKHF